MTYATFKTLAQAQDALDDMLAAGEVSPGERPRIERRGKRFVILLSGV